MNDGERRLAWSWRYWAAGSSHAWFTQEFFFFFNLSWFNFGSYHLLQDEFWLMCSYSLRQFRSESFTFSVPLPPAPKLSRQRSPHCHHPSLNHHHFLPGWLQQPLHWYSAFHPGLLIVCSYQRTKGTLWKHKPDQVTLLLKIPKDFSSQTKSQSSFNGQHGPPRSDPCAVTLSPPTFP